jgi:MFS superfamily sulfate permease-like transporter
VNGSPTKTEMVDEAGGRSQVAHLSTAAIVLLVLLFLTKPLSFLPSAVLSAIVFMIGVKLIDAHGMQDLYQLQRNEPSSTSCPGLTLKGAKCIPSKRRPRKSTITTLFGDA